MFPQSKGRNKKLNGRDLRRGDIFYADLSPVVGSEQGGLRPVLVVQNDIGNTYSPTTVIAAITSQISGNKLPTHVTLNTFDSPLTKTSIVLLEQIRTVDKKRLTTFVGSLSKTKMKEIEKAMLVSLGFF